MTVTEFKALLERYLKRNDLADLYDDFIQMAETRINAVMRLPEMEKVTQFTPTSPFTAFPGDFIELRHVQATVNNGPRPLEYVTPEQADIKRRLLDSTGFAFYTIVDNQIEIIPHPSIESETEVELFYYAQVQPLGSVGAQSTTILNKYPNLYLYATLIEAAAYREADNAITQWTGIFDAHAAQLNERAQAARFSGNSIQMRAV